MMDNSTVVLPTLTNLQPLKHDRDSDIQPVVSLR